MVLVFAVAVGLAATFVRARIKKRKLRQISPRWEWLVFISVLPQILIFYVRGSGRFVPESVIPYIQVLSMLGLITFTAINIRISSFWVIGVGLLSNFAAIIANKGWMPISVETLGKLHPELPPDHWIVGQRLGSSKDRILTEDTTNLGFLSDTIPVPSWISYKFAFSIGDVILSIGIILLLWSLSNEEKE